MKYILCHSNRDIKVYKKLFYVISDICILTLLCNICNMFLCKICHMFVDWTTLTLTIRKMVPLNSCFKYVILHCTIINVWYKITKPKKTHQTFERLFLYIFLICVVSEIIFLMSKNDFDKLQLCKNKKFVCSLCNTKYSS